jgi:UDP-glucuronate 4-epimerase
MLTGQRIVITGATGKAALPIAAALARDNEVIGVGRFVDASGRERLRRLGVTPAAADLAAGDFSALPGDADYVLHFAWMRADLAQLEAAIRANVEGAGLLIQHYRRAKAVLVVSSMGVYSRHPDPMHLYAEHDPIGRGATAYAQTSPATKLGLEAVARFCGRAFDVPITIARLNTVLGPTTAYHGALWRMVEQGREIVLPGAPNAHSPIHGDDMIDQIPALLEAASPRALIVNWCGDEVVTTQETLARTAEILGKPALARVVEDPAAPMGNAADPSLRRSITGPCRVAFWDGFAQLAEAMSGPEANG